MRVTGTVGESITIPCKYPTAYGSYVKFWCKGDCRRSTLLGGGGKDLVKTAEGERYKREGRLSLQDDPAAGVFTVTITDLNPQDEGTDYHCAVEIRLLIDWYQEVELRVRPAEGGLAIEVQKLFNVKNGQQASITCKYDRYYKDYVKYWCRGYYRNSCSVVVTTSGKLQQGSVTIKDERDRSEILVTISDLKLEDSNWYWCGIEISQWRDKMDYTKINVTEAPDSEERQNSTDTILLTQIKVEKHN
ncbi:CMRF35-like molecule 8 [Latimeria chalumnae]|uniref:CMRF35-like molecule 8 n=1 Tax=Latimeria chalumnae TaxID=7897 RepID=UPI00313CC7EC